jgi:hypothetical protein
MNERLKELALQSGFETLPSKLKVSFGDNESTTSTWEYPHEKFAELIVAECIDAALEAQADYYVINNIKSRLGVEE